MNNISSKSTGSQTPYLKKGVHRRTRSYALLGAAAIVWLALNMPISLVQIKVIPLSTWIVSALTTVFSLIVVAVDSLPGPNGKAILVFWRCRHPLPGSRAFDKANFERDSRIDREHLRNVVGGKFPRSAKQQNTTWYRLYKQVEGDTTIRAMHFDYLLFRDLSWLSVVLCLLSLANIVFWPPSAPLLGLSAGAFCLLYLLFRRAAVERGERFVNQVLLASSAPDNS